ncbi:MAG: 50S ribosomal protein L31 [Actinobacteria bacterium]|nr:50S ribosomal protein L31 [Actinomycetota bacterium]
MKTDIHPDYIECRVTCSCGNQFVTRATVAELRVELCAECHPFYTGKQKLVDTGGRVERFQRRYSQAQAGPQSGQRVEGAGAAEATTEGEEAAAKPKRKKRAPEAPKRKPPVAIKGGPRPKIERRPPRDDDRRDRGRDRPRRRDQETEPTPEAPAAEAPAGEAPANEEPEAS